MSAQVIFINHMYRPSPEKLQENREIQEEIVSLKAGLSNALAGEDKYKKSAAWQSFHKRFRAKIRIEPPPEE